MGCILSKIDVEERMQNCKERKRLMKQLVGLRGEFANAQMAYLRSLKNTGVTLRQLTESESLELETTPFGLALPPSPPPPLPPSPPPPPVFSPDLRKFYDDQKVAVAQEEIVEIDEDNECTPPPPPIPSSTWDFWDPFCPPSPYFEKKSETVEPDEEENWVEASSEFVDDNQEAEVVINNVVNVIPEKRKTVELVDDNSSMVSWHTKDTTDMAMVVWRSKKTFAGIVKELDDYFLKASAGGRDIAVFMDINLGDTFHFQNSKENKRKRYNSSKVFSALAWSWSSKSYQLTRDALELYGHIEPCTPGAHCITLAKLYAEEQKLYKQLKEEEVTKFEHERKSLLLQKEEDENHDWTKTEKTRLSVETLQSDIIHLQQSISRTCSSILKLIDDELHPQLVALISGLMHVWRTMYQCHQVQNHISQQLNHISDQQSMDPTTDYHRHAAAQLKTEVNFWYIIFCKLIKSQQEYVRTVYRWIQLTACLMDDCQLSVSSSALCTLCEEWQLALDRLPDKVASEAIKNLLAVIHSIMLQQQEELNLQKKSEKLEKKLQRELKSVAEMEIKFEGSISIEDAQAVLGPKHPLSVKRAKIGVLRKQVDDEKAKYINSVQVTRAMTLNNLKTSLPNVFQSLMGFSSTCSQSFEAILLRARPADRADRCDASLSPTC
ncbi:protein ALTERED PHOSPHATE STARVATION RESPONSE 1 [Cornus florida]|uniref:protein ALTERED PHOSPHATE STARVATION RESPONSE 1 n=1 Tax=Cornus florida TaxID=4283 RepID=UPI00289A1EBD|nr:protein ALTERED PHOSPHATE STARVATION RESPONSE 1 [Cornus florida]